MCGFSRQRLIQESALEACESTVSSVKFIHQQRTLLQQLPIKKQHFAQETTPGNFAKLKTQALTKIK